MMGRAHHRGMKPHRATAHLAQAIAMPAAFPYAPAPFILREKFSAQFETPAIRGFPPGSEERHARLAGD
jgi:hypothetical protein